ncbi:hypothetical protein ACA910_010842 [Epithemia clementina (nom. ined.)]
MLRSKYRSLLMAVLTININQSFSLAFFAAHNDHASRVVGSPNAKAKFRDSRCCVQNHRFAADDPISTKEDSDNVYDLILNTLLPAKSCDARRMSSTDLAYIGDVVYELFVRSQFVWPSRRTKDLQKQVVARVRAEFQAELLAKMRTSFNLTSSENAILSRGRNAVSGSTRNKDPVAYQDATALEALIGYLFIQNQPRCAQLLEWMKPHIQATDG